MSKSFGARSCWGMCCDAAPWKILQSAQNVFCLRAAATRFFAGHVKNCEAKEKGPHLHVAP